MDLFALMSNKISCQGFGIKRFFSAFFQHVPGAYTQQEMAGNGLF